MASTRKTDVHSLLYKFLADRAKDESAFTFSDIRKVVTSWKEAGTWNTYVSKKLKPYVERRGDRYVVRRAFRKVSEPEFEQLFTQKSDPVPTWSRVTYDHVVSFEFLMPLTREDKLRAALDEVFFRDTVDERTIVFSDAERDELREVMPLRPKETEEAYRARVANQLAEIIGGYSITHVAGRFRAGNIVSRRDAAAKLVQRLPYLIDETTAVVRFIMPCPGSRRVHNDRFSYDGRADGQRLSADISLIRTLFFLYFAEAIAATIVGEQLIWLVERSPEGERIYAWEKASPARRARMTTNSSGGPVSAGDAFLGEMPVQAASSPGDAGPSEDTRASGRRKTHVATSQGAASVLSTARPSTVRAWLRTNGYTDVADRIDEVITEWRSKGKSTRRNWWDVLAGDADGNPCTVAGRQFPVLVAAQRRQGRKITANAIQRSAAESRPE